MKKVILAIVMLAASPALAGTVRVDADRLRVGLYVLQAQMPCNWDRNISKTYFYGNYRNPDGETLYQDSITPTSISAEQEVITATFSKSVLTEPNGNRPLVNIEILFKTSNRQCKTSGFGFGSGFVQ